MLSIFLLFVFSSPYSQSTELLKTQVIPPKQTCTGFDLFQAVELQDMNCFKQALKQMNVNEADLNGNTPLHRAILLKNASAIPLLLKYGANLSARNHALQTPRELCEAKGYRALAEYFSGIELETDRLRNAIEFNNREAVSASLKRGASLGTTDTRADTPLHQAIQSNLSEVAKLLIRQGAPVDARNYLGETPLHAAALRGFTEAMKALLLEGADVNALNWRRETPLDLVEARGDSLGRNLLRKHRAKRGVSQSVPLDFIGSAESP